MPIFHRYVNREGCFLTGSRPLRDDEIDTLLQFQGREYLYWNYQVSVVAEQELVSAGCYEGSSVPSPLLNDLIRRGEITTGCHRPRPLTPNYLQLLRLIQDNISLVFQVWSFCIRSSRPTPTKHIMDAVKELQSVHDNQRFEYVKLIVDHYCHMRDKDRFRETDCFAARKLEEKLPNYTTIVQRQQLNPFLCAHPQLNCLDV